MAVVAIEHESSINPKRPSKKLGSQQTSKMPQYSKLQLEKIIAVQELTLSYTHKGVTQKWVYENKVRHQHGIPQRTYDRWMALNAKRMLHELEKSGNR